MFVYIHCSADQH